MQTTYAYVCVFSSNLVRAPVFSSGVWLTNRGHISSLREYIHLLFSYNRGKLRVRDRIRYPPLYFIFLVKAVRSHTKYEGGFTPGFSFALNSLPPPRGACRVRYFVRVPTELPG